MKTHGWDADMTTAAIEAAQSSGRDKEKLQNRKLGFRLTESAVDTESNSDDYIEFKKFICDKLHASKLDHCQQGAESFGNCFTDHPFCRMIINKLVA